MAHRQVTQLQTCSDLTNIAASQRPSSPTVFPGSTDLTRQEAGPVVRAARGSIGSKHRQRKKKLRRRYGSIGTGKQRRRVRKLVTSTYTSILRLSYNITIVLLNCVVSIDLSTFFIQSNERWIRQSHQSGVGNGAAESVSEGETSEEFRT